MSASRARNIMNKGGTRQKSPNKANQLKIRTDPELISRVEHLILVIRKIFGFSYI